MTDATMTVLDPSTELRLHRLTGAFLDGYRNANTRNSYLQQLHRWFAWCTAHQLDPLAVERTHIELYLRWFERQVGSNQHRLPRPLGPRLVLPLARPDRPARHHPDRRGPSPSRDETPRQTRLTRHELADWLNVAEQTGGAVYAMACLLLLNGLRVSEICGINIDALAEERWHYTVTIHGKATRTPPCPSPRAPVPRSSKPSTNATPVRCCAIGGATG